MAFYILLSKILVNSSGIVHLGICGLVSDPAHLPTR